VKTRVVIARFDDDSDTVEVTLVLRRYPSGIYGSENHVTLQAANHEVVLSSEVLTSLESAEDVPRLVEELIIDGYNAHQRLPVAFTDQTLP
jgi:hypothetical protein